jgi:hypothetical protein
MHRVVYHHVELFRNYYEAHHANPEAYIGAPLTKGDLPVRR